jgi:prolycopene isomerase
LPRCGCTRERLRPGSASSGSRGCSPRSSKAGRATRGEASRSSSTRSSLVYAATTHDLHAYDHAHEIFLYRSWDLDEVWRQTLAGEPSALTITVPTLVDPSLAPPGEHLVTTVALAPSVLDTPWPELKDRWTEAIVDVLEGQFPGIRDRLTFLEGATPLALEKYSLNRGGAMYGWENVPTQSHARRLPNTTPIEGLYLASAWTQPGSGTIAAMQSGFQTAQIVLGYRDKLEFLRAVGIEAEPAGGPGGAG